MRQNITQLWGHIFALLFTALLLLVDTNFFQTQPLLSALFLSMFAVFYLAAAFARRQALIAYPGILLLVITFNLLLYALGVPTVFLALTTSVLVTVLYLLARWLANKGQSFLSSALNGSALLLVAFLVVFIFLQIWDYDPLGFLSASLSLFVLAWSFLLRSLLGHRTWHEWAFTILAVTGYLFALHVFPLLAMYLSALSIAAVAAWNLARNRLWGESLLLGAIAACIALASYFKIPAANAGLGFAAGIIALMSLSLSRYRHLQDVIPALVGAFALLLISVVVTFPWIRYNELFPFLILTAGAYILTGKVLLARERSMVGLLLGHGHLALGEIIALIALVVAAFKGLTIGYASGITALLVAIAAALAAFYVNPMAVKFRRHLFYLAGLTATYAFLAALWRPNPFWNAPGNLWLGLLLILVLHGIAEAFASRTDRTGYETLLEVPAIAVALTGVVYLLNRPQGFSIDLLLPIAFALPGVFFYQKSKQSQALASSIVAAVVFLLGMLMAAGVAAVGTSLIFLVLGIALIAWELGASDSRLSYLRFFSLGVVTVASAAMGFPWSLVGVSILAAWAVVYFIAATLLGENRRMAQIGLEVASYALMVLTALALAVQVMVLPAAIIATIYALCFFFTMARRRQAVYLYPAGVSAILAAFLFALVAGRAAAYVLVAFPLTLVFYGVGAWFKSASLSDWRARSVAPLYLGGHLNAAAGAAAFVLLAPNLGDFAALLGGALLLVVYAWMGYRRQEQIFWAGVSLATALLALVLLSFLPFVQRANVVGYFAPVILVLLAAGWLLRQDKQTQASWAVFSAAMALTLVTSGVALWGERLSQPGVWTALVVGSIVWLTLLLLTRLDMFVYLITASLALLCYSFVRTVADRFLSEVFIFLVYGCLLLAVIFIYDVIKSRMRFRAPIHFGRPILRRDWLIYGIPALVLAGVAFAGFGVESTSVPSFCNLCHTMNAYYANWQTSSHAQAGVGCADCHYEPTAQSFVRNKIVGLSEVVKVATGTENYMIMAVVSDSSCLRGGCHTTTTLKKAPVQLASGVSLNHANHIDRTLRGVQVTCTVCHTMTRADQHFSINQEACLLCHLKPGKNTQIAANQCLTCHSIDTVLTKGGFSHGTLIMSSKAPDCTTCHAGVTPGDGRIKDECSACHLQDTQQLLRAESAKIHQIHVTEKGFGCDRCHQATQHGSAPALSETTTPPPTPTAARTPGATGMLPKTPANHAGRTQCLVCHTTGGGSAPKVPTKNPDHSIFKDDNDASLCLMCHAR